MQVIWGRLRAAQRARGRRWRAGRAYGEPLVGAAVAAQAAGARAMPELRTVGDEAKAAWMQVRLSEYSVSLLAAAHVPFRRLQSLASVGAPCKQQLGCLCTCDLPCCPRTCPLAA